MLGCTYTHDDEHPPAYNLPAQHTLHTCDTLISNERLVNPPAARINLRIAQNNISNIWRCLHCTTTVTLLPTNNLTFVMITFCVHFLLFAYKRWPSTAPSFSLHFFYPPFPLCAGGILLFLCVCGGGGGEGVFWGVCHLLLRVLCVKLHLGRKLQRESRATNLVTEPFAVSVNTLCVLA